MYHFLFTSIFLKKRIVKNSLLIFIFFILGILCGIFTLLPVKIIPTSFVAYVVYALIFFVGIGAGANVKVWHAVRRMHFKVVLVPLAVIGGTFMGVGLTSFLLSDIALNQALAVGAGFGYYSLSSVMISQMDGDFLGIIALISNLMREIITILLAPVLVRFFGKIAPIAVGGATSMDTTLAVITRASGSEYAVISIFSGMVLTLLVPLLVPLFLGR